MVSPTAAAAPDQANPNSGSQKPQTGESGSATAEIADAPTSEQTGALPPPTPDGQSSKRDKDEAVSPAGRPPVPPPPQPRRSRSPAGGAKTGRRNRRHALGSGSSSDGARRRRSITPMRQHSPQRERGVRRLPRRSTALTKCWHGLDCKRKDCWFLHPDGRRIDTDRRADRRAAGGAQQRRPGGRRALQSRSRSKRRSPSAWAPRVSPSHSPVRRASPSKASKASASCRSTRSPPRSPSSSSSHRRAGSEDPKQSGQQTSRSFRAYVQELDDGVTPEEALAKFSEFKESLAKQDFDNFKQTGLFTDLYHPLAVLRRHDLRVCLAHRSARTFKEDLRDGRYSGLRLRAPAPAAGSRQSATCPVFGSRQAPHFVFDADVDTLELGSIPPAVSFWDLFDCLQQCLGFVAVSVAQPVSPDLTRAIRARFASKQQASAAAEALAKQQPVGNGYAACPSMLAPSLGLSALVAPPEMSHPDRISQDELLSASIVRRLDELLGIEADVTQAVLSFDGPPELKLDLQVLYLRRIHHFCFYSAVWCADEWELRSKCGAALLRCHAGADDALPEKGEWATKHEQRVEAFLRTASLDLPRGIADVEEAFPQKASALCDQNMLCIAEARFQCKPCGKLFKGPDFVHKHVRKVHPELFQAVYAELQQETAAVAFRADKNKPNIETMPPAIS